jgi:hypothetical protein
MRILGTWPRDFVSTPSARRLEEDSVVAAIKNSFGGDAGLVLIGVIRGTGPYPIKDIAGTVYARLGPPPLPLEEVVQDLDTHDSSSIASSMAAFRGLSRMELQGKSVSPSRAYFVCSLADLVGKDSGSVYLVGVLVNAILTLKVERIGGSDAAASVLGTPEVSRGVDWLRAHRYDVGR